MLLNCGVGEDFWDSLDWKDIQPVHPKANQPWIFIGRPDVEAKALILWPPGAMNRLIWKDHDSGKDWRQKAKAMTEHEMTGCLHWWVDISLNKLWELVMYREAWHASVHGIIKSMKWLCNWTELKWPHHKTSLLSQLGNHLSDISKAEIETNIPKVNIWIPRCKGSKWDELGDWNWHIHTTLYKIWRRECNPLPCSCLENLMDEGARWAPSHGSLVGTTHGVTRSQTRLSDSHTHIHI